MKNLTYVILITLHVSLFTFHSYSQPCLPEGIAFETQEQIDSFQVSYPGCTEIEGDVLIAGDDITNLYGISLLTSIGGNLHIGICEFMTTIGTSLVNFEGLNNLEFIGGDFKFSNNDLLTDLSGLESLLAIEGDLIIGGNTPAGFSCGNSSLINLSGLDNLETIGGSLETASNDLLKSFTGLEKLDSIEGIFTIDPIETLSELNNLLYIGNNGLKVKNTALSSFTGLENVSTIGGDMMIDGNDSLSNLVGLENLDSIHGDLTIGGWILRGSGNPILNNLEALVNLTFIGGNLYINRNASITSLTGLNNLTTIDGGKIDIGSEHQSWANGGNISLVSLVDLDNIDGNSITELVIINNTSLTSCHVDGICDYLTSPYGIIEIHDNAPGCNSQQEVEDECPQSVQEIPTINNLSIYPNPFANSTTIEFKLKQPELLTITIYNHLGEKIEMLIGSKSVGQQKIEWDCEGLPSGVYFCVLKTNNGVETTKMIKL